MTPQFLKEQLGAAIAQRFQSSQTVACGTGSTVDTCFPILKAAIVSGKLSNISVMATSLETEAQAGAAGCTIIPLGSECKFDWGFDGADVVLLPSSTPTHRFSVIKGGGGAHYRERLVADQLLMQNKPYVIIADHTKVVRSNLAEGNFPIPIEIEKFSSTYVSKYLKAKLGATSVTERPRAKAKYGKDCYEIRGNIILDAEFSTIEEGLSHKINSITGVLTCGLFERYASELLIAQPDGEVISTKID
jgi:ribose 5-phosphate isomerase